MIKLFFTLLIFALLGSCQQEATTYTYLLQHPAVLKKELVHCKSMSASTSSPTSHCEMVQQAENDFIALLNQQQMDPEAFGQKILNLQMQAQATTSQQTKQSQYDDIAIALAVVGASRVE